jgi:hypothetical protein
MALGTIKFDGKTVKHGHYDTPEKVCPGVWLTGYDFGRPIYRTRVVDLGNCSRITLPDGRVGTISTSPVGGNSTLTTIDYLLRRQKGTLQVLGYSTTGGRYPLFTGCPVLEFS